MATDSTNPAQLDVQAFAQALIHPLCDEPDGITVFVTASEGEAACQVTVSQDDYMRLSNGRGRTVRSISTVLGAAAAKLGTRCSLTLCSEQ